MNNSVFQAWVQQLPWKQQSILSSGLRGPDQEYLINIKMVSKWIRSVTQNNADPSKPYMNGITLPSCEDLYKELEHCPCHFVHHFLDALAIVAYNHPDKEISDYAAVVHYSCAEEIFHFQPESPFTFNLRHRDKRGGIDPHTEQWQQHEIKARMAYFVDVSAYRDRLVRT